MSETLEHKNPVLNKAAELKAAYDEKYAVHAFHLGVLSVKKDMFALLAVGYKEYSDAAETTPDQTFRTPDQRAACLIAHSINVLASPLLNELQNSQHDVDASQLEVDKALAKANKHYLANRDAYLSAVLASAPTEQPEPAYDVA